MPTKPLLLLICFLGACSPGNKETSLAVDSTAVETLTGPLKEEIEHIHATLSANPAFKEFASHKWLRLQRDPETPSDIYIENDCNGDNPYFTITLSPDNLYLLRWYYPVDYKEYAVVEYSNLENSTLLVTKEFIGFDSWQTASLNEITITNEIDEGPVINWKEGSEVTYLFTPERNSKAFTARQFGCEETGNPVSEVFEELKLNDDFIHLEKQWILAEADENSPSGYYIYPECVGNSTLTIVQDEERSEARLEYRGMQDIAQFTLLDVDETPTDIIMICLDSRGERVEKKFAKLDPGLSSIKDTEDTHNNIYLPVSNKSKVTVKQVTCE